MTGKLTPAAIFGAAILVLGIAVLIGSFSIPVGFSYDAAGPRLFPLLIGSGLCVSAVVVLLDARSDEPSPASAAEDETPTDWRPVVIISAALLFEAALITTLGWIPVTATVFAAGTWAFGDRRIWRNLAIGVAFATFILVAFNFGLGLNLPLGPLEALLGSAR